MIKKILKFFGYAVALVVLLISLTLAIAYWNRDALLLKVTSELNKGIDGKFEIGSINFTFLHSFPNFSITLQNVTLHDNQFQRSGQQLLSAKKVFVDIAFYPLLKKQIAINSIELNEADIFLFKTQRGETNSDIFNRKADSVSTNVNHHELPFVSGVNQIDFTDVSMVYVDSTREKVISFKFLDTKNSIMPTDSGYDISIAGKVHFDSLHFNSKSGSFLENEGASIILYTNLNTQTKSLTILPASTVRFEKTSIELNGNFQVKKNGLFTIAFKSNSADPVKMQTLLNERLKKTLEKFRIKEPITVEVVLNGVSTPGNIPAVDIVFSTKETDLGYASLDFSSVALTGSFTNHIDDSRVKDNNNSKVIISHFKGEMEEIPIEGNVSFTKLQDPIIDLSFTSKLTHKDLNAHLDNDRFVLNKGNFISRVKYKGKLSEYLDPTRTRYSGKLNGSVAATNGSLFYKPKKIQVDQVQLNAVFTENLFEIKNLTLELNGSPIALHGTVKDFIPFFIQPKNKAVVALDVSSTKLDLTPVTTPRQTKKKSKRQNQQSRKRMTELMDLVYDRLEFDVNLSVKELTFRKFKAQNISGRVKLNNQHLNANPLSMTVAGGTMNLNFSMNNLFENITPMAVKAGIRNADIKELFLNFNHFNQKAIHADNLRGKISADVNFSANVNDAYNLITSSMRGTLDCKIVNGGIVNFEPMENMSNFLFKKRDFSDVEFAELISNFSIKGTDMDISRMEIQSTVLSFFVEGRYSFTDSTSLSVQIPLSNLKKRDKNFKPKNIGTHAKAGPSVFLHVHRDKDINSKIKIDYDPFKKWAKN